MSPYVKRLLDDSLFGPVDDFTGCQGKRIRGSLLQVSYESSGGVGQVSTVVSEAIESLHAGSLIIDDIQDGSQTRRGRPTLHQRIGVPLAINAGNWLYFHAVEQLSSTSLAELREPLMTAMIQAARQCHEGQAIDIFARIDRTPTNHWHESTRAISTLKTGALVALAAEMGCIAGHADSTLRSVWSQFGRQIGIALQMRNDLDELAKIAISHHDGPSKDSIHDDDLRNARLTWPWTWALELYGRRRCEQWAQRVLISESDRHEVAVDLFELTGNHGATAIRSIVREQLWLLGEHSIDRRLLASLSEILEPIVRPLFSAAVVEGEPTESVLVNQSSNPVAGTVTL